MCYPLYCQSTCIIQLPVFTNFQQVIEFTIIPNGRDHFNPLHNYVSMDFHYDLNLNTLNYLSFYKVYFNTI